MVRVRFTVRDRVMVRGRGSIMVSFKLSELICLHQQEKQFFHCLNCLL